MKYEEVRKKDATNQCGVREKSKHTIIMLFSQLQDICLADSRLSTCHKIQMCSQQ